MHRPKIYTSKCDSYQGTGSALHFAKKQGSLAKVWLLANSCLSIMHVRKRYAKRGSYIGIQLVDGGKRY